MKTLLIYVSKHGCTAKCAQELASQLGRETTLANLREGTPDLKEFDGIILGGPIYAGNLPQEMKKFMSANGDSLQNKKLGLFICCGQVENGPEQLDTAFPQALRSHASVQASFGGAISLEKQNFLIRTMLKKVMKIQASYESIDSEAIADFARQWA